MGVIRSLVFLIFSLTIGCPASAQDNKWPERPIKLIVTTAPGGGIDIAARLIVDGMNRFLPQPIVIENQGGAGGLIATRLVAKSQPDGYTFLFQGPGHTYLPYLYRNPGYDVHKDLTSVTVAVSFPSVLATRPDLPVKTVSDFIDMAKAAPGKYSFGSSGVGGASHIPLEAFVQQAGIKMLHVPFRGSNQATTALLGGQIDLILDGLPAQIGNIRQGLVRAIGTPSPKRTPYMPDVPAIAEAVPGYEAPIWLAIFAPAGTQPEIIEKMRAALLATFQNPETRKRYDERMFELIGSTPKEMDTLLEKQFETNGAVIRKLGISMSE